MSKPIQASLKRYLNVGLLRIIGKKKKARLTLVFRLWKIIICTDLCLKGIPLEMTGMVRLISRRIHVSA